MLSEFVTPSKFGVCFVLDRVKKQYGNRLVVVCFHLLLADVVPVRYWRLDRTLPWNVSDVVSGIRRAICRPHHLLNALVFRSDTCWLPRGKILI